MSTVVDELISRPAFCHGPATERLFEQAMAEAFRLHFEASPEFRAFFEHHGFDDPASVGERPLEDWPFIFVNVFKSRDLVTGRREDVVLELTSSGTGGRKSRNFLDQLSLDRIKRIARNVYDALGMVSEGEVVDYVCFTYDPAIAGDLGTAFTDELLTSFTTRGEVFYAIRFDESKKDFFFDVERTMACIERFAARGRAVRLLGFPAFIHSLLLLREERSLPDIDLGPSSWALTGGGWKTHEGRAIPRHEFSAVLERRFGIPAANVRDLFGMVEHGVPYVQCEMASFHVPVYSKPIIRRPVGLEPAAEGETGLLQLMTPYWTSYPALSILTGDLARIGPPCGCGRPGPTLEVVGRGGVRKHKGCAIQAAELLKGR